MITQSSTPPAAAPSCGVYHSRISLSAKKQAIVTGASVPAGKLADFIVLDRDGLAIPVEQLKDIQVLEIWVGGELVYRKPLRCGGIGPLSWGTPSFGVNAYAEWQLCHLVPR
jgi:hypothetical protein